MGPGAGAAKLYILVVILVIAVFGLVEICVNQLTITLIVYIRDISKYPIKERYLPLNIWTRMNTITTIQTTFPFVHSSIYMYMNRMYL